MAVEHSYVAQSLDGGVYWRAPLGTTLPTAPVESPEDLNAAFEDHGTAAVDGLSVGITRTSNTVKDFDGGDYVDVQTEYGTSFKIKLLDVDLPSVKRTVAGDDNVTLIPAAGGKGQRYHVRHNSSQLPLSAHVFATKCGKKFKTYVVEKGRVSEIAEWKDESQDASGVELTIRAFRNSNGDYVDEFGDVDGIAATSGS